MLALTATPCLGCNALTTGSVGPTRTRWPFICQPCKDKADNEAQAKAAAVAHTIKAAFSLLGDRETDCGVCDGYGASERGDGTLCMHCSGEGRVKECNNCGHDYVRGESCKKGCR